MAMLGDYDDDSTDGSDDSGSEWNSQSEDEVQVVQAISGFEDGRYRVHWEGEEESTLELPTFALAEMYYHR